ncbi:hypothetical protein BGZ97_001284 [Linnemannia gamsii]|uniref:Rad60/SUMO-like domain-containing protein n=1 Tax=Linnemannia gamsii TaxID=64522 RepID=A0A9P6R1G7_9FUNG|nr:hypothetical protein BGZ97_001284 [Linnemannia gamsii]
MSDSDDNKPVQKKPQPRPRAKRSKVSSSTSAAANSTSSPKSALSSPHSSKNSSNVFADNYSERVEDDFFNRGSVSFRQIQKIQESRVNEELTRQEEELEILDLKAPPATDELSTLDLDDDLETTGKIAAAQKKAAQETKRKREISLTPPPELPTRRPPTHIPNVGRPATTVATATVIDLDDDDFEKTNELDPELASIAAKLNTIASQQSMEGASPLSPGSSLSQPFANSSLSQSQSSQPSQPSPSIPAAATATVSSYGSSSSSGTVGAYPGATGSPHQPSSPSNYHTVLLVVRMNRHPLLVVPPELVEAQRILERPVQVTVRSNNMFREMMTFYCNQKGLNYSLTVFTYLGIRLMPSSTPAALDFPARVIIDAYSQDAYKYIKEQETLERSRKLADMERQAAEAAAAAAFEQQQQSGGGGDGGEQHGDADVGDDTSDEYIFIKLRGKDTADEKIRVKKTATVHAIISHYKSIKRIPASTIVRLEFDDEALDSTTIIGNTEVEDDDMLVVRVG